MSAPQPLPLLLPKQLQSLVLEGGTEIVVETRPGEQRRFFLHVFDEAEREEVVRAHTTCSKIHERMLADLKWARVTLWNDMRLQQYLYSHDWMTWPSLPELSSMVDLVRSAKETDEVPDFVGANALKKALDIISMELMYPGLHALKEEPLAGPIMAFGTTRADGCVVGDKMHALLDGGAGRRLGSCVWVLELKTQFFTPDEAVRLPLTTRVREECLRVMQQPCLGGAADSGDAWKAVLAAHRRRRDEFGLGLFCSVPEALLQFGVTPGHLARTMCEAAEKGRRVRLRVGIYVTVLQRTEVYAITRAPCQGVGAGDQLELKAAFERTTGHRYDACEEAGLLLHITERETLEDALRLRFLSPLATAHEIAGNTPLTSAVQLTRVVVRYNPFALLHGPRVVGAFPENSGVRGALSELLFSREGSAPAAAPSPGDQTTTATAATMASATLTGEQLRRALDEAVFKTLSLEPMKKAVLSAHGNMARFRRLANFEALLKDSLKRNAEYRGSKYYLRE
ncbi:putative amino acid tansporter [Trypanosoma rangeli]|uniref:Putative amino acid tansporter n=1 Tax=Trypanosoma rangeli TaxID=5698 RepID=A0A3R7MVK8_TRYRA|nr:putative amino acid tansporter [Trypanosoma rangeli]RNF08732.1 putative amino acid tansporter [Trypanosoma rangeli]|eukprot:RNF08732.1 putative amino acid tansporter [Trypanosoma rangeli]